MSSIFKDLHMDWVSSVWGSDDRDLSNTPIEIYGYDLNLLFIISLSTSYVN